MTLAKIQEAQWMYGMKGPHGLDVIAPWYRSGDGRKQRPLATGQYRPENEQKKGESEDSPCGD